MTSQFDDDEALAMALSLQLEEDSLMAAEKDGFEVITSPKLSQKRINSKITSKLALSDPQWETIDPTPNIHTLFLEFNDEFFWGKLSAVEVGWSKRMTTCAGICYYSGRRSGYCRIGLSEPLLKLRARKELVETLLHEMIHAFLFVTNNNKDHDGHGPEFHKHMHRINADTGLKISVYHTFHEEVAHYKRHWWRCDGVCRNKQPFYGYVKRATNRAPSKNDLWWAEHQRSCGGNFVKVKEPEDYQQKKKGKKSNSNIELSSQSQTNKGFQSQMTSRVGKPKIGETPGKDIRQFLNNRTNSPISFNQPSTSQKSNDNNSQLKKSMESKSLSTIVCDSDQSDDDCIVQSTSSSGNVDPISVDTRHAIAEARMKRFAGSLLLVNNRPKNSLGKLIGTKNVTNTQEINSLPAAEIFKNKKEVSPASLTISSSESQNFSQESPTVTCPVCGINVAETTINLHLDVCLLS